MALIKCTECGKEISELAEVCPSCGHPMGQLKADEERYLYRKKWKGRFFWGFGIVFVGLASLGYSIGLGIFVIFIGALTIGVAKDSLERSR